MAGLGLSRARASASKVKLSIRVEETRLFEAKCVSRTRNEYLNMPQLFFDILRDVSRETIGLGSISDKPLPPHTYNFVRDVPDKNIEILAPQRMESADALFFSVFFVRFGTQRRHQRKWSIGPRSGPG